MNPTNLRASRGPSHWDLSHLLVSSSSFSRWAKSHSPWPVIFWFWFPCGLRRILNMYAYSDVDLYWRRRLASDEFMNVAEEYNGQFLLAQEACGRVYLWWIKQMKEFQSPKDDCSYHIKGFLLSWQIYFWYHLQVTTFCLCRISKTISVL